VNEFVVVGILVAMELKLSKRSDLSVFLKFFFVFFFVFGFGFGFVWSHSQIT